MASTTEQPRDIRIGEVFAGRYEISRRLGAGGMAVVYAGLDRMLQREVALKILKPKAMDDPQAAERLRREARAAGQLHHRHIITFHDVGQHEATIFIVMELLRGRTLAAERRRCSRLPALRVARIGAQIASALRVVHGAGIIHRDLKPDNVFLIDDAGEDFVKLLDFSIAKLPATLVDGRITQTGTVHGTPHYMPPEQAMGDPVSPSADIYALGAVLFEMLVGKPPFEAGNVVELLTVQSTEDAPRVSDFERDCPQRLDQLVTRMLSRKAAERPEDAEEVERALAAIAERCLDSGDAPPPLTGHRKKLAQANRTAAHTRDPNVDAALGSEPIPAPDETPTGPLDAPPVRAPSALDFKVAQEEPPSRRRVKRPTSVRARAVKRRGTAPGQAPTPARGTSAGRARTPSAALRVARASARTSSVHRPSDLRDAEASAQMEPTAPEPSPPKSAGPAPATPPDAALPDASLPDTSLPDAAPARRPTPQRSRKSTVPSWSGQTGDRHEAVSRPGGADSADEPG